MPTLLLYVFSFSFNHENKAVTYGGKPFATISGNSYKYITDTIQYKKFLEDNLLHEESVKLNKVEIVKQLTLVAKKEFYYVMASSKDGKYKIAKWLNKKGNKLYENNVIEEGVLFEQSYLTCIGDGTCGPQVLQDDENRMWGCSEDIKCYINNGKKDNCQACKSIIGID